MTVRPLFAFLAIGLMSVSGVPAVAQKQAAFKYQAELAKAVADPRRTPANAERDRAPGRTRLLQLDLLPHAVDQQAPSHEHARGRPARAMLVEAPHRHG